MARAKARTRAARRAEPTRRGLSSSPMHCTRRPVSARSGAGCRPRSSIASRRRWRRSSPSWSRVSAPGRSPTTARAPDEVLLDWIADMPCARSAQISTTTVTALRSLLRGGLSRHRHHGQGVPDRRASARPASSAAPCRAGFRIGPGHCAGVSTIPDWRFLRAVRGTRAAPCPIAIAFMILRTRFARPCTNGERSRLRRDAQGARGARTVSCACLTGVFDEGVCGTLPAEGRTLQRGERLRGPHQPLRRNEHVRAGVSGSAAACDPSAAAGPER